MGIERLLSIHGTLDKDFQRWLYFSWDLKDSRNKVNRKDRDTIITGEIYGLSLDSMTWYNQFARTSLFSTFIR